MQALNALPWLPLWGSCQHYGAPAKAQHKRVWWGEEVRRRERDLPRLSGARREIHSLHRRD